MGGFIFKDTEPSPAQDSSGVRQKGDLLGPPPVVCVECLIGKQKKPILFKVTEPSSIPYRTHSTCAKMAANPDPPPVIPVPDTGGGQAAAYAETLLPGSAGPKC